MLVFLNSTVCLFIFDPLFETWLQYYFHNCGFRRDHVQSVLLYTNTNIITWDYK